MKTLIQFVVVALIFGGVSAAVTVFTQMRTAVPTLASSESDPVQSAEHAKPEGEAPPVASAASEHAEPAGPNHPDDARPEEHPEVPDARVEEPHDVPVKKDPHVPAPPAPALHDSGHAPVAGGDSSKPKDVPVAVRPAYAPEGDEAGALINLLRERSRNTADIERRLAERQDAMQMIFEDLRAEQARTLKIRQNLSMELKASRESLDTALKIIDEERVALQRDQAATRKAAEDAVRAANEERDRLRKQMEQPATSPEASAGLRSNDTAGPPEDNVNLKKMASVFDSMPAENVAKVFEQLVKNKRPDAVVALMNAMKERQSAKVLGLIAESNPELAADLTDRLKRLQTSTAKPVAE